LTFDEKTIFKSNLDLMVNLEFGEFGGCISVEFVEFTSIFRGVRLVQDSVCVSEGTRDLNWVAGWFGVAFQVECRFV
jgi:hypothetical protein